MSNIFVREIVGSSGGDLKVPANDTELATATARLATQINTLSNFTYDAVLAWVETKDGGSAPRTLNCAIQGFTYFVEECPDTTEVGTMTAAIKAAIEAYDSTTVGEQQVSLFQVSQVAPWIRDPAGFIYPNVATDDLYIGGSSPNGVWKDDGDMVLGAASMAGTEVLRVVGDARVEGKLTVTGVIDPDGMGFDEQASVPITPAPGIGILWVRNDTPNVLIFTDDAGTDFILGAGGGGVWTDGGTYIYPTNNENVVIGAAAMSGTEALRVVGDLRVEGDFEVFGAGLTFTMSGAGDRLELTGLGASFEIGGSSGSLGEGIYVTSDSNNSQYVGIGSSLADTLLTGGSLFTAFSAKFVSAGGGSAGTFAGFSVPATGGSYSWTTIGFYYPNMFGTALQSSYGFKQDGIYEINEFQGRTGFTSSPLVNTSVGAGVPASGTAVTRIGFWAKRSYSGLSTIDWTGFLADNNITGGTDFRDYFGFRVNGPTGNAGTDIRNVYGLYVGDLQADGDLTYTNTPYGIYQGGAGDINVLAGSTTIGAASAPTASAVLDLSSTTGALLVPRMSTLQIGNLTAANGMIVYDTTLNAFYFYENGSWVTK